MNNRNEKLLTQIDELNGVDQGQGFSHQLAINRDWCDAMNALHYILLRKWYYIGIVTTTKRNSNKLLQKGVEFSRRRESLDVGLRSILNLGENSYRDIKEKIRQQRIKSGQNRDIWHFSSDWKEMPKGTALIEVHQSLYRTLLGSKDVRNGFVVLDGRASMTDQNSAMQIINKIFSEKDFTARILEKAKKDKDQPNLVKAENSRNARKPGTLILKLKEDFAKVMPSITAVEKTLMDKYFDHLKLTEQHSKEHDKLQKMIERDWAKRK